MDFWTALGTGGALMLVFAVVSRVLNSPPVVIARHRRWTQRDPQNPEAWEKLSAYLATYGQFDAAKAAAERLLEIPNITPFWRATAVSHLGMTALDLGESLRAIELLTEAQGIAPTGEALLHSRILQALADAHEALGNLGDAERCEKRSLDRAEEAGNPAGIAISLSNLGKFARIRGALDEAETLIKRMLALTEASGDIRLIAVACRGLADVRRDQGDLQSQETLLLKALRLFEEAKRATKDIAGCLRELSDVYARRGDSAKAAMYLGRALQMYELSAKSIPWDREVQAALLQLRAKFPTS